MILFVATLHLALGYALAVYLGFAPLGPSAALATATVIPSAFDEEIVIADDLDEQEEEPTAETDEIEIPADDPPIVEDEMAEAENDKQHVEDEVETAAPPTPTETANLSETMARLLTVSTEMRSSLAENADRLWEAPEDDAAGKDAAALLSSSLSDTIQKLNALEMPSLEANDPVLAARKKFLQHLSAVLDQSNGIDAGDDEAYRQTLRRTVLDAHEAAYELGEAMVDIHARIWSDTDSVADKNQEPLASADARLADRLDVLRSLDAFWPTGSDDRQPLVAAMLDMDHCRRLNGELGPTRCDRLIDHVAGIVEKAIPNPYALGLISGQRLVVLIPDKLLNAATEDIELAREIVAKTTFTTGNGEHKVTATCAIAEATPDERPEALFRRLAETLQEAKRYGRNRTFLHEGTYPAPVVPPPLDVEPQVIELT